MRRRSHLLPLIAQLLTCPFNSETCQDKVNVVDEERSQARDQMQKLKDSMNQATLALTNAKNALQQRQTHESRRTELSEVIERHQNNLEVILPVKMSHVRFVLIVAVFTGHREANPRDSRAPEKARRRADRASKSSRRATVCLTEGKVDSPAEHGSDEQHFRTDRSVRDGCQTLNCSIFSTDNLLCGSFERCDAPGKLERTERKIKDLGEQIRQRRSAERTVLDNVDRVKSDIASASNVEANIRANQLYRAKQRKERETKAAREALDVPAAEKAHRRFNEDFEAGRQVVANKNAAVSDRFIVSKRYALTQIMIIAGPAGW